MFDQPSAPFSIDPLWHGILAPKQLTLLAGWPKSGRTSLVLALLREMQAGGELAGQPVRAGRALAITHRQHEYPDAPHVRVCIPSLGAEDRWLALIRSILAAVREQPFDLVVIDSILLFPPAQALVSLPRLREALHYLHALADLGPAFLLVHYFRGRTSPPGRRAAGPGLLCDSMDVVLELDYLGRRDLLDPRRRLAAFPRDGQPTRQVIAFDRAQRRYTLAADTARPALDPQPLRGLLAAAAEPLTRDQLLAAWPAGRLRPSSVTLWRWLQQDVAAGLLHSQGTGRCGDPFRYRLVDPPRSTALS